MLLEPMRFPVKPIFFVFMLPNLAFSAYPDPGKQTGAEWIAIGARKSPPAKLSVNKKPIGSISDGVVFSSKLEYADDQKSPLGKTYRLMYMVTELNCKNKTYVTPATFFYSGGGALVDQWQGDRSLSQVRVLKEGDPAHKLHDLFCAGFVSTPKTTPTSPDASEGKRDSKFESICQSLGYKLGDESFTRCVKQLEKN